MKTFILAMAALLTFNVTVLAADDDTQISVRVVKSQEKQALIRVTNISEESPATLRIRNQQGTTLYRELITSQAYMKKYDFSKMPSGEYTVEVKTKSGVSKEVFNIAEGKSQAVYFKPAIQVETDLVKVAFINRIASPVTLKLYANNGDLLYEESVASQAEYSKGLNVSRLQAGQYSLAIVGNNYVYSRSIDLK